MSIRHCMKPFLGPVINSCIKILIFINLKICTQKLMKYSICILNQVNQMRAKTSRAFVMESALFRFCKQTVADGQKLDVMKQTTPTHIYGNQIKIIS